MLKIKKGDIVDIVAPAGFCEPEVLFKAVTELNKWGLIARTKIDFTAFHPFHSDDDDIRFEDLKEALTNKESKIVWCLRGGYGSGRLLNSLAKMKKPKHKKLVIGYSDITALHTFLSQNWGWESVHGPTISTFSNKKFDKKCLAELKDILFGKTKTFKMELGPLNAAAEKAKTKITGKITGGNLAMLQTLIGTKFQLKAKGKIVIIEDVNEKGYQVDRMLYHLLSSNALQGAKAIVFGDFTGGAEANGESFVEFSIMRFAIDNKIPVFSTSEFGHGNINRPLVCGQNYSIEKGILKTTIS